MRVRVHPSQRYLLAAATALILLVAAAIPLSTWASDRDGYTHLLPVLPGEMLSVVEPALMANGFRWSVYAPYAPTLEPIRMRHHAVHEKRLELVLDDGRELAVPVGSVVSLTDGLGTLYVHTLANPRTGAEVVYWFHYERVFDPPGRSMDVLRGVLDDLFPGLPSSCHRIDNHGVGYMFEAFLDGDFGAYAGSRPYPCLSPETDFAQSHVAIPSATDLRWAHVSAPTARGRFTLTVSVVNTLAAEIARDRLRAYWLARPE